MMVFLFIFLSHIINLTLNVDTVYLKTYNQCNSCQHRACLMLIRNNLFYLFLTLLSHPVFAADITVTVENIKNTDGAIHIALFTATDNFPDSSTRTEGMVMETEQDSVTGTFSNLPENDYAIAVFHDENGNGKLDKNFFGIPKEPYGFSGNSTGLTPPSFNEASTTLATDDVSLNITLR
ncbi:MAG: DUF2141 domain-containing protein [Gammaproteobacteria bacterium]|nr:MAG: DUF2141 domain-containing protein [Gammaproteobacteria bacterium]